MSNLQIIEHLAMIVEEQIILIKEMSARLEELDALKEYEERIEKARQDYVNVLGANEAM